MALPTTAGTGTLAGSTGTVSPAWPTHSAGQIGLLIVITAFQNPAVLTTPNGFVATPIIDVADGTAVTDGISVTVFWCLATSSGMTAPLVADSGNNTAARIIVFDGCDTTTPWNVLHSNAAGSATTAVSITGDTTTVNDCLVVLIAAWADDSASGSLASITNASLASLTLLCNEGHIAGNGGGFAVFTGTKATAGVVSASTGTLSLGASYQACAMVALKPPASAATVGSRNGRVAGPGNRLTRSSYQGAPCQAC